MPHLARVGNDNEKDNRGKKTNPPPALGKDKGGKKKNPPPVVGNNGKKDNGKKDNIGKRKNPPPVDDNDGTNARGGKKKNPPPVLPRPELKRRKKGNDSDPLWIDPPDDAYAPYFEEFQSKRAPNFTAVEDLILCKAYAAV